MKKYIIYALVAFAFTLSSCADSSKSPSSNPMAPESSNLPTVSANAATTYKYDLNSGLIWNPCCNEYITITGTVHYTYKDGVYHFHISNFKGVDANGNTYNGHYTYNYTYDYDGQGADGYTYIYKIGMKSKTGCSFSITYKVHYKWNANGELVVDNYEYEIDCD